MGDVLLTGGDGWPPDLHPDHVEVLRVRGVSPEVARERGYWSALPVRSVAGTCGPYSAAVLDRGALAIPIHDVTGAVRHVVMRPDRPRASRRGNGERPVKYEAPLGARPCLDCPPRCRAAIGDPAVPLVVTEGPIKGDALASHGFAALAVSGVWAWKSPNDHGASVALGDWEAVALSGPAGPRTIYLAFDSDVHEKSQVKRALDRLRQFLAARGAAVRVVAIPPSDDGGKQGVDDYLAAHGPDALRALMAAAPETRPPSPAREVEVREVAALDTPLAVRDGTAYALAARTVLREVAEVRDRDGTVRVLDPPRRERVRCLSVLVHRPGSAPVVHDGTPRSPVPTVGDAEVAVRADDLPPRAPTLAALRRYAAGERVPGPEVWGRVVRAVDHYLDLSAAPCGHDAAVEVLAAWVMATWWTRPAGLNASYLVVTGPKGSGKTWALSVVAALSYCGDLVLSTATTAALRDLARAGATLAVDEAEGLGTRPRDTAGEDRRALLLGGTRPDALVALREPSPRGTGWVTVRVPVHGCRAFGAIRSPDEVMGSRCIALPMVRTPDPARSRRDPAIPGDWPEPPDRLRDDLTVWALATLPDAARWYAAARERWPSGGRDAQPWVPLAAVALCVDAVDGGDRYDRLVEAARAMAADAVPDWDRAVVRAIWSLYEAGSLPEVRDGVVRVRPSEVVAAMDTLDDPDDREAARSAVQRVGWCLRRVRLGTWGRDPRSRVRVTDVPVEVLRARATAYGVIPPGPKRPKRPICHDSGDLRESKNVRTAPVCGRFSDRVTPRDHAISDVSDVYLGGMDGDEVADPDPDPDPDGVPVGRVEV